MPDDIVAELAAEADTTRESAITKLDAVHDTIVRALAHNDSMISQNGKIRGDRLLEKIEEKYGIKVGRKTLDAWCRARLGRKSWGRP